MEPWCYTILYAGEKTTFQVKILLIDKNFLTLFICPFRSKDKNILEKLIITGEYSMEEIQWKDISLYAKDLVKRMLTVKPENRITISEILKHSWLSRVSYIDPNLKMYGPVKL